MKDHRLCAIRRLPALWLLLVLAGLACSLPVAGNRSPVYQDPIPVSTQAVESLVESIAQAQQQAEQTGIVSIQISETQLTSIIVYELQNAETVPLQNLRLYLRDGRVQFAAEIVQGEQFLPLVINFNILITPQGGLAHQIIDASIGGLPIAEPILAQLTAQVDPLLAASLNNLSANLFIQTITIADGFLTLNGVTR